MSENIKKYNKTTSHVSDVTLKSVDMSTLSMEVTSDFVEKECTEITSVNPRTHALQTHIKENILRKWKTVDTYLLHQVKPKELLKLRLSKVPGVVYKKDNQFFYGVIPSSFNLTGKADSLGTHACSEQCAMVCNGCPRTTDLTVAFQQRIGKRFYAAVVNSWRIEKYDFITEGLESFNMSGQNDTFIVFQCKNYQVKTYNFTKPKKSVADMKVGLASYYWDDFHGTRKDMLARIRSNEKKDED